MHLTIVGGCFPVQYNIEPGRLYHATLRQRLAAQHQGQLPELHVIRYERLSNCLAKIMAAQARQPTQVLLFHVRAEPVLRLSKLYYRYLDDQGRVRHSFNLPGTNPGRAEQVDLLTRPVPTGSALAMPLPVSAPQYARLRHLNLRLGRWLGHERRARHHYAALVLQVAGFCRSEGIRLVVVGPVSRPCSAYENELSARLHRHFAALAAREELEYLPALGETDATGQPLFFPNGIHVSPAGHDRMAGLLYEQLVAR
jgi:hypothetical protein